MKHFYSLLLIGAALLSGSVYGMEETKINNFRPLINFLTERGYYEKDREYQTATPYHTVPLIILPLIEQFIIQENKQPDEYAMLCTAYLNLCFSSSECNAEMIERMLKERFIGDTWYAPCKQFVIGQLKLEKLDAVIKTAAESKDIDAILDWLLMFDGTNHVHERSLVDGLNQIIEAKTPKGLILVSKMQDWERNILQKGGTLQGLGKKFIEPLRDKEHKERNQRQQLRADAENRKDQIVTQIFNALKTNQNEQLNKLVQDELIGLNAPLAGHLNYINEQIQTRIQKNKTIKNGQDLLNIWNAKFRFIQEQRALEDEQFWKEAEQNDKRELEQKREQERQVAEQRRQDQEKERQRIEQWAQEQRRIEEQRDNQTVEERREEQRRQFLEQEQAKKSSLDDLINKVNAKPMPDPSTGVAALFASITAPKLAVAAVVIGVCYWGYTKYKAYKAEQSTDKAVSVDNNEQAARTTQSVQKKENIQNKQRVR